PEQARGEVVDPRSDIYSCGVMLYEMATGEVPFRAKAPVTILLAHVSDPPRPPRLINARLDRRLDAVILKALEKEPALRQQSGRELRADLRRITYGSASSSSTRKAVRKSSAPPPIPRDESQEPTLEEKRAVPKRAFGDDQEPTLERKGPSRYPTPPPAPEIER